jgi:hypothetical protein
LGFKDINYSSTLKIWQLHQESEPSGKVDSLFESLEQKGLSHPPQSPILLENLQNNGSTIVGHGGDFMELLLKLLVLTELDNPKWKMTEGQRMSIEEFRAEIETNIIEAAIITTEDKLIREHHLCFPSYVDNKTEVCAIALPQDMLDGKHLITVADTWEKDFMSGNGIHVVRALAINFIMNSVCKKYECTDKNGGDYIKKDE